MTVRLAGCFPDRVHRPLGNADVDCVYADFGGGNRPDRRTARQIAARYKGLHRHARLDAQILEYRCGLAIGGVALIGIDLNCRPAV